MIHIQRGQVVIGNSDFVSLAPSGNYNAIDLIECAHIARPDFPICMFQVQCIAYGNSVYQQDGPLTRDQITELKKGVAFDQVLNNKELRLNLSNEVIAGKIFGKNGLVKDFTVGEPVVEREEQEEEISRDEVDDVPDTEPPIDTTPVDTTPTDTIPNTPNIDVTPIAIPGDTLAPDKTIKQQEQILDDTIPLTPVRDILNVRNIKSKITKAIVKSGKKIAENKIKNIVRGGGRA